MKPISSRNKLEAVTLGETKLCVVRALEAAVKTAAVFYIEDPRWKTMRLSGIGMSLAWVKPTGFDDRRFGLFLPNLDPIQTREFSFRATLTDYAVVNGACAFNKYKLRGTGRLYNNVGIWIPTEVAFDWDSHHCVMWFDNSFIAGQIHSEAKLDRGRSYQKRQIDR